MAEDKADKIARLLQRGLDAYGEYDVPTAIEAWTEVLELDPENAEATDFMRTADRRSTPRPSGGSLADKVRDDLFAESRRLIGEGQFEEALELLRQASDASDFCFELEATIELMRGNLFAAYHESVGSLTGVPMLAADAREITKFNLPSDAGFLLSLVDGLTDLESLMTVSGMDTFEALRTTKNLIDVGILRMQP